MGTFTDWAENKFLEFIVGKTTWTMPTIYVALFTTACTDAAAGTECTGGSYSRKSTTGTDWGTAAAGAIANSAAITFVTATALWGTVTYFALYDAITSGNYIGWGQLTTSKAIDSGDTAVFSIGDLDLTMD